jgi:O-antigen/teichoic acid export membrane protein
MYLNGTGKVGFEVSWAIPMAIVNVGLSIYLTQRIGISGVAWGTSISYFLLMVVPTTVYLRRVLKLTPGQLRNE